MSIALVGASHVVTMAEPLGAIPGGALRIEGDRIAAVGPDVSTDGAEVFDVGGRVVTPGLVDAHTHLVFAGSRAAEVEARGAGNSYREIAEAGGGIQATVRATRAASDDELLRLALQRASAMRACGTTAFEAKTGYGLAVEHELCLLRLAQEVGERTGMLVVPTLLAAHAVPTFDGREREEYLDEVLTRTLPEGKQAGARFCDMFCEAGYFTTECAERMAVVAGDLGLGLRLHVDQFGDHGGAALAARLHASTADHLEYADPSAFPAMAAAGVRPVLLPGSVLGLGLDHYPAARRMLDAGLEVVLATDLNPGSSPVVSLPFCMALAVRFLGMSFAETLAATTIHAARSLDLGDEIGSLELGKRADVVVWDTDDVRDLAYWVGAPQPFAVCVGGRLTPR